MLWRNNFYGFAEEVTENSKKKTNVLSFFSFCRLFHRSNIINELSKWQQTQIWDSLRTHYDEGKVTEKCAYSIKQEVILSYHEVNVITSAVSNDPCFNTHTGSDFDNERQYQFRGACAAKNSSVSIPLDP